VAVVAGALFSLVTSAAQWRVMEMGREGKITDRLAMGAAWAPLDRFHRVGTRGAARAADAAVWV